MGVSRVEVIDGPENRFFFRNHDGRYANVWIDGSSDFAPGAWALNADGPHDEAWFQREMLDLSPLDTGKPTTEDLRELASDLVRAQREGPRPDAPLVEYSTGLRCEPGDSRAVAGLAELAAMHLFQLVEQIEASY